MEEINQGIKELWAQTYSGDDIKTILIRAEPVEGGGIRKLFSYKVVYINKDDRELEMRGRCSLGQKVLSCIVIRIALAEAFGTNCGILALDEPTTNLDRNNIQKLAEFLCNLVESRKDSGYFQLIIITHDREFIKA